jgi:antitoxin component of MazEF toxin-antitoxin module
MKFDILQNKTSQLQLQISQGNQIQPPKSGTVIPEDVQVQPPQSGTVIPEDVQKQIQLPESGSGLVIPEAVQKQIEQKVEDSVRQMVNNHFQVICPNVKVKVSFHHPIITITVCPTL